MSKRVIATLIASLLSAGVVGFVGLVLTAAASPASARPTVTTTAGTASAVLTSCGYGPRQSDTASKAGCGKNADTSPTTTDPTTTDPTTVAPQSSGNPSGPSFDTGGTVAHTKTGVSAPMIATASAVFVAGIALLVVLGWRRRRDGDKELPGTVA